MPDGFGPEHVNVADQKRDPDSLWNFMRHLIQTYRECPELGWGDFTVLQQPQRQVLAHRCHWEGSAVVAVHNLSADPVTATFPLDPRDTEGEGPIWLEDLLAARLGGARARRHGRLPLDGYGHRWFRVRRDDLPRP